MPIVLSENFRALFYAPFYASYATGAFARAGVRLVGAAALGALAACVGVVAFVSASAPQPGVAAGCAAVALAGR